MADTGLTEVAWQSLEDWDLNPVAVKEVSRAENVVFRVATQEGGIFVLRIHRPGYHSFDELLSEQLWTSALDRAGVDVPVPRVTRSGALYSRVRIGDELHFVGVLEWVEGETIDTLLEANTDIGYAESRFQQLGELLAALHNQASDWQPPAEFNRVVLDAEGLMGEKPNWGPFWQATVLMPEQRVHFEALREKIFDILCRLPKTADHFSMIHADLHPGNVVVNGERLHLIDFDDAGFGWHVYDFAVALKNFEKHQQFGHFQAALVKGYRRVRAVDDETLALIPLFLLIRALASIGWADARPELNFGDYVQSLVNYVDERAEGVLASIP